ncbi:unnamed protein product, partial [Polarella glacialis]
MGCGNVKQKAKKYGQICPNAEAQGLQELRLLEAQATAAEAELKLITAEVAFMAAEDEAARRLREEEVAAAERRAKQLASVQPLLEPVLNYVILVMGQTGSGKTSLLNLLGNLDMAFPDGMVPLELLRKFATHTVGDKTLESAADDEMASKTSDANIYAIKIGNVGFTIIDTPGFGDSRGLDLDEKHVKLIVGCLERVGEINCVLLTINGREARLNATLKYVLSVLTSVMPSTVLGNVAVVFTNTENERKLNFKMGELEKIGLLSPPFVCLENPLSALGRALQEGDDLDDALVADTQASIQQALATIASLFGRIKSWDPVPTVHFKEVYEQREAIEVLLSNAHEKYKEAELNAREVVRIRDEILRTGKVKPEIVETMEWRLRAKDQSYFVCHHSDCHQNCSPAFP